MNSVRPKEPIPKGNLNRQHPKLASIKLRRKMTDLGPSTGNKSSNPKSVNLDSGPAYRRGDALVATEFGDALAAQPFQDDADFLLG
jgi:hypothetical protein